MSACATTGLGKVDAANTHCLNDEQVHTMVAPALVYVWSPRMVLSALEAQQAKAAADSKGVQFVPVVDGRLPTVEWQAAWVRLTSLAPVSAQALASSAPLCSPQLVSQLAYRHFPTGFLVMNGKVHPAPLVGAMPQGFWSEALRLRMTDGVLPSATAYLPNPETK